MTPRQRADGLFAEAVGRFRAGDRDAAYRLVAEAVDADPTHAEASLELARLHVAARRNDEAAQVLTRALAASPDHAGLATNLGVLLCERQDYGAGLQWLERVASRAPGDARAHFNLANGLKAAGRNEAAIVRYRQALACDPGLVPVYRNLGNCLVDAGAVEEAVAVYDAGTRLRRSPQAPPDDFRTSEGKLRHDIEQIEYLARQGAIGSGAEALAAGYRRAAALLPAPAAGTHVVDLPPASRRELAGTYNRLWHCAEAPALAAGGVSHRLDRAAIEADYARRQPGITFVDEFLTPEALQALRRFCLESTIWFSFRYANGYLGAFWEDGFSCPLLLQIAEDMRRALPGIFRHHRLRKMWAFKYDSRLAGIPIHADFAAVNVNFWITPDSANLDPGHGGLVVWDKEAPADWDFKTYNTDEARIRTFLGANEAQSVVVPYRQNRAVIFNSDLFHETDRIVFAEGYENRRINITLLFGTRHG